MSISEQNNTFNILDFAHEGGEIGKLIAGYDWSATPLGDIKSWPQSLRTCVHIMLSSRQPIWIGWGKELIKLYNDPYKSILGGKHPRALGAPAKVVWKDIWKDIEPMLNQVMERGVGTYVESQLLIMERNGYAEETYYTFSYTPVPGDDGKIAGMFCANTDDTERIINERQLKTLTQLGKRLTDCKTANEVIIKALVTLEENPQDFPFAIFRKLDNDQLTLTYSTPLGESAPYIEKRYNLDTDESIIALTMKEAIASRKPQLIDEPEEISSKLPKGAWAIHPHKTIVLPIIPTGQKDVLGVLNVGLNPYRLFDEKYRSFFLLVTDQIATSLADVNALEEERKRAEALAEIDRAKTTFFSNISHELRTPLTLMLAPIEDTLHDINTISENRIRMEIAHSNAIRLLKLVNTLLDFSRIEAGRMNARYVQVNLSQFTSDLISSFRAAIESAGMTLMVDTGEDIQGYVDTDMWEKIVLNLVSNAFKYTHQGTISVRLLQQHDEIRLIVTDTGIGIPENELEKIFERFHRVENIGGRSQEGTGIGLSLVQELIKLHGGTIKVESQVSKGSVFTITIPAGKAHLPEAHVGNDEGLHFQSRHHTNMYVGEAVKWLSGYQQDAADDSVSELMPVAPSVADDNATGKKRILLADDNSDMRAYLGRLLSKNYVVTAVKNGKEALQQAIETTPDLILSDVMMPELNGFELVRILKAKPETRQVPIMLLSARAGEEATIEGLATGADDYLIKPFSARELLSRIDSNLKIAENRINSIRQIYDLFENAPVAIAILRGKEQRFELANEKYLQLAGKKSIVGKTLEEAFPELVDKGIKELLDNVYTTSEPFYGNEFEVDLVRQDKSEHLYLNFTYSPFKDTDGIVIGVMVIAIDVTAMVLARRKMEQVVAERTEELMRANYELQLSENRYHRMIDEIEDYAIILLDKNGIVQNWNKGAEKIKGYSENEIVGKSFDIFYLEEDRKRSAPQELLQEATLLGKASREGWRVKKGGAKFWGGILMTALHDDKGNVIGFSKVTRDLTERKVAEDTLREYSASLEAQNRELEQFAYAASHDMKEPLRKILFFGSSLQDRVGAQLDSKSADYLSRILSSIKKMTDLVDNLLTYSKTTANTDVIEKVDLNVILSDVLSGIYNDIDDDSIEIHAAVLPVIMGIPFQCAQLLDNLINNAIKYRHPDRKCVINIDYEVVSGVEARGLPEFDYHKISFIDNGIGFDQQYAEKIFEIFQRLITTRDKTGAGIGLAICKRIVLNHNGLINATGVEGEGARFDVYLPVTPVE